MKGSDTTGAVGVYSGGAATLTPGACQGATGWAAPGGNLYLFGGATDGVTTFHNDLWLYNTGTGNWTLVKGDGTTNLNGSYGTQGTPGAGNIPGARRIASGWVAKDGNLWLFGGQGKGKTTATTGDLNDLWRFDIALNQWEWVRLFIYGGVGRVKRTCCKPLGISVATMAIVSCTRPQKHSPTILSSPFAAVTPCNFGRNRSLDVLLIDDIQFIAGNESTQEELFHTFNELHSQGKQVVISSDRAPKAMATLEERLQSRFEWGLMTDIQMPDIETRKAILQTKAEANGLAVPDELMDFIAQQVRHSIRELEGAFNKVMAYAHLSGGRVNMELVNMALADLMHRPDKLTVEHVFDAVCKYYNLTNDDLVGGSRKKGIAYPRQMAMYLARTETNASLPQIGEKLGNRNHTTVLYGYEKIATLIDADATIRRDCMEIKSSMYSSTPS